MSKYPNIKVKLTGTDGNAFSIMGKVKTALRTNGIPDSEVKLFLDEAMSGDYNKVIRTAMEWVTVR